MSAWNSDTLTVEPWEPQPHPTHAGWALVDCGCCAGIRWGGEEPVECSSCGAGGWLHVHLASGITSYGPGGPLTGRLDGDELDRIRAALNGRRVRCVNCGRNYPADDEGRCECGFFASDRVATADFQGPTTQEPDSGRPS